MPHSHSGTQCCASDFGAWYDQYQHPVFRELELAVLGSDYGGTSWTTIRQADDLAVALELGAGRKLLEIGAGSGWPGAYLARRTACETTLLDIPFNALGLARDRVLRDGMGDFVRLVNADGTRLPFRNAQFDAISHSDVLCCVEDKRELLNECMRAIRPGGLMHFYVIEPGPDLSGQDLDDAITAGPPFIGTDEPYPELLVSTGWTMLGMGDDTDRYLECLRVMEGALEENEARFVEVMGQGPFDEEMTNRGLQIDAVSRGLILRRHYHLRRPED